MAFRISSRAFPAGGPIPLHYTADGDDVSPPLEWAAVPAGTKTLSLVCEDPDAPGGTFVHWVVYNIPTSVVLFPEAFPPLRSLPNGTRQGVNDFGGIGYRGPAPPSGIHRYFFKLYAASAVLDAEEGVRKAQLEKWLQRRIVGQAETMGTYGRK
jgi:Raf kinase inhibitor-like YbhB/YbcL family protein